MENDEVLTFERWGNKFALFEEVLRCFKSRHCILIGCNDNQFNGQKKRLQSWESLSSFVEEFDSVGHYSTTCEFYKKQKGNTYMTIVHFRFKNLTRTDLIFSYLPASRVGI